MSKIYPHRLPLCATAAKRKNEREEMETRKKQLTILAHNANEVEEKIGALNKKAVKLGQAPITYTIGEVEIVEEVDEIGNPVKKAYRVVEIEDRKVVLEGWQFLAKIEHEGDAGNIVKKMDNEVEIDAKYWKGKQTCEHCNINRARHMTYLLKKEEVVKQVGSTCLFDFLGHDPMQALKFRCAYDGLMGDMDEYRKGGSSYNYWSVEDIIGAATASILTCGYVSRAKADETMKQATADHVMNLLSPKCEDKIEQTSEMVWVAGETLKMLEELSKKNLEEVDDYKKNLIVAYKMKHVDYSKVGIIASSVAAYLREKEAERWAKEKAGREAMKVESKHVGQVGDKIEKAVKIIMAHCYENRFGYGTMYKMIDEEKNVYTWFTSGRADMNEERTYSLKMTIKAHDEYQGQKQTVVTRCKILQEVK